MSNFLLTAIEAERAKATRALEALEARNERNGINPGWLNIYDADYIRYLRASSRQQGARIAAGMVTTLARARLSADIATAKVDVVQALEEYRRLDAEFDAWHTEEHPDDDEEPDWGDVCDARDVHEDAHDRLTALKLLRRLSGKRKLS
jgi:hypothetical protein